MSHVLVVLAKNINIAMDNSNNLFKYVQVVVGLLINDASQILMTQRALHLHQGGLWEFPGGKIESGETHEDALKREFREEVAIEIQSIQPFITIEHQYSDKNVILHTYQITQYSGTPKICDGQLDLEWVSLKSWNQNDYPIPAANLRIINKLLFS